MTRPSQDSRPAIASAEAEFVPQTPDLQYERRGDVAFLTFNRPQAYNAMTWAMYEGLLQASEYVDRDERVHAFVLRGAGDRAFVSGTDISQFRAFASEADALAYERGQNRYFSRLEAVQKPTIAMVRGYCVGGGASLALACDLRVAASDARFGVPIARTLGNTLSTQNLGRLLRLIGPARTKELLFTARLVDASEGFTLGLFNRVVPPEALEAEALELASAIAANAPLTVRSTKEGVRRLLDASGPVVDDDLILLCYMSEDFQEGVSAFLEKRPPRWQGR
jgi:enoyl-CoA hydratase/carnithine racemase